MRRSGLARSTLVRDAVLDIATQNILEFARHAPRTTLAGRPL